MASKKTAMRNSTMAMRPTTTTTRTIDGDVFLDLRLGHPFQSKASLLGQHFLESQEAHSAQHPREISLLRDLC
jgi:hypothetical protein